MIRDVLLSRWKWDAVPRLAPAKIALMRTLALYDETREHVATLSQDPKLTGIGRQDAIRKHIAEKAAADLHRSRKSVEVMRAKLAQWRARLAPALPDKTDAAGAALRSEMRVMLRGMTNGARMQVLLSPNADPLLWTAVLEAPNVMSGVTDETRERILTASIEKAHAEQLPLIAAAEEAASLLDAAARVAFTTVRAAAEFPHDSMLADFVQSAIGNTATVDADVQRQFDTLGVVA